MPMASHGATVTLWDEPGWLVCACLERSPKNGYIAMNTSGSRFFIAHRDYVTDKPIHQNLRMAGLEYGTPFIMTYEHRRFGLDKFLREDRRSKPGLYLLHSKDGFPMNISLQKAFPDGIANLLKDYEP